MKGFAENVFTFCKNLCRKPDEGLFWQGKIIPLSSLKGYYPDKAYTG